MIINYFIQVSEEKKYKDTQNAAITISLIQYNILSLVRRVDDYEIIGGLLSDSAEKTVLIQIFDILMSVIIEIAEFSNSDVDTIFEKCINDNERFNKLINISAL